MHDASIIEINLTAIAANVRLLRKIVGPDCLLCPIVKADAYGLGAPRISRTLLAAGAGMLAVYTPSQAAELIKAAITEPILVLMPVREIDRVDDLYRGLICGKLHLTVHDHDHLQTLIALSERFGAGVPVHLEVDTGMSRGGCALEDAPAILERIARDKRLQLAGLFTHFADAERDVELTEKQLAAFDNLVAEQAEHIPASCYIHAASTYATLRAQRYHKSMVRIGLAWAGYGIETLTAGEIISEGQYLEPAITWRSSIVQVRQIPAGASVGYGSRWTAERQSVIGLVPVGYADGYPVRAGDRCQVIGDRASRTPDTYHLSPVSCSVGVRCNGALRFAPVVGSVSMDQITIDLTDLSQGDSADIGVGTEVELITPDATAPNHLPTVAQHGGTFAHEMMCRLNPRLKRVYRTSLPTRKDAAPQPTAARPAAVR